MSSVKFEMHPKLAYDVITRQAGTLDKAILEGVMNSVDAGATKCEITLEPDRVQIRDNGRGFRTKKEIMTFFRVLGLPKSPEEEKKFGTFRMGRGQMFAFGKNVWQSGNYQMTVDLKSWKDYDAVFSLEKLDRRVRGCHIDIQLYEPVMDYRFQRVVKAVQYLVRYMPIPVIVNGTNVSRDPESEEWDVVNDDAYIRLDSNGMLAVYNQGAHVRDYGTWEFGLGGCVVTKKPVQINFARNDIHDNCAVWKRIRKVVREIASERLFDGKTRLTPAERRSIFSQIQTEELRPSQVRKMKLFRSVSGQCYSWQQIEKRYYDYQNSVIRFAMAKEGDMKADRLLQTRLAFVFSDQCVFAEADCTSLAEFERLIGKFVRNSATVVWKSVDSLAAGISDSFDVLADSEGSKKEMIWIRSLRAANRKYGDRSRTVVLGHSVLAEMWTDGATYVAVSRVFLKQLPLNLRGCIHAAAAFFHELSHDFNTTNSHVHSPEFNERFRELMESDRFSAFASYLYKQLIVAANREYKQRALKRQEENHDRVEQLEALVQ